MHKFLPLIFATTGCALQPLAPSERPESISIEARKLSSSQSSIKFDSKLLLPWTEASKDLSTAKSPALYRYARDGKVLYYLASKHSNLQTSPTFQIIEKLFKVGKLDAVILEGFSPDYGWSPRSIALPGIEKAKDGFYPNGEPSFAMQLALDSNIPFIGAEPSDSVIYRKALEKGYSPEDLLGFSFVRQVPGARRSGEIQKVGIERAYEDYVAWKSKSFGITGIDFPFSKFLNWYKEKNLKEFSPEAIENGEAAPIDSGPFFTQKIAIDITRIRDEHILEIISSVLANRRTVLIIYGSSHFRIEHRALAAGLGQPMEIQDLNNLDP